MAIGKGHGGEVTDEGGIETVFVIVGRDRDSGSFSLQDSRYVLAEYSITGRRI